MRADFDEMLVKVSEAEGVTPTEVLGPRRYHPLPFVRRVFIECLLRSGWTGMEIARESGWWPQVIYDLKRNPNYQRILSDADTIMEAA